MGGGSSSKNTYNYWDAAKGEWVKGDKDKPPEGITPPAAAPQQPNFTPAVPPALIQQLQGGFNPDFVNSITSPMMMNAPIMPKALPAMPGYTPSSKDDESKDDKSKDGRMSSPFSRKGK